MSATALLDLGPMRGLRRVEYDKLAEAGGFGDDRVELLYGMVVARAPKGPPHESAVQKLTRLLVRTYDERAIVRVGAPLAASDGSEPEPDLAVVPLGDYDREHPKTALLVIEVSQSSLAMDTGLKAGLYAECSVPEYWVVDLADELVIVHTEVVRGSYARKTPYRRGESIPLPLVPGARAVVDDILPTPR